MCITEEKLVDRYGQGNPHERFMLIYKNYEVFLNLVESYEAGLFNRILYEREYNLRAKNGEDVGVRIQSNRISDPTARQPVKKTAREIVCKKTDSEKRDELLINGQSKSFICKSLVSVHYVGKSLEKPRIVPEEPTKSG